MIYLREIECYLDGDCEIYVQFLELFPPDPIREIGLRRCKVCF